MQRLEVSGAVRPLYESLGFKGLTYYLKIIKTPHQLNIFTWHQILKTSIKKGQKMNR